MEANAAHGRLSDRTFDLLVIGGGIFGAGVAREAALNGNSVALVEQGDLAEGTSSRSSKLLHGGLRYLEHGDFRLVRESLRERAVLAELAPHLAWPLPFLVPLSQSTRLKPWKLRLGLWLYDRLAGRPEGFRPSFLSAASLAETAPALRTGGSRGAGRYFDWQTFDSRLVLECAVQAAEANAVVATQCEVVAIRGGPPDLFRVSMQARDSAGNESQIEARARVVIATTGPFCDRFRSSVLHRSAETARLTSGIHVVVQEIDPHHAWLLTAPQDGRVFFVIPFFGRTLIGTTDRDFTGDPRGLRVTDGDVDYLLDAANSALANPRLTKDDVISSFIGVRALARGGAAHPSSTSREQIYFEEPKGVWHVVGGKLTTWRLIARALLEKAAAGGALRLDDGTLSRCTPLPGGCFGRGSDRGQSAKDLARFARIEPALALHLETRYGSRAARVAELFRDDPRLTTPLLANFPETHGELLYSRRFEFSTSLDDFLRRRTPRALLDRISPAELTHLQRVWRSLSSS